MPVNPVALTTRSRWRPRPTRSRSPRSAGVPRSRTRGGQGQDGNPTTQGGIWLLTDLETATALGMTVVKIANQNGDFVPVDQASVVAGVKSMKQTDNGLLLPDRSGRRQGRWGHPLPACLRRVRGWFQLSPS